MKAKEAPGTGSNHKALTSDSPQRFPSLSSLTPHVILGSPSNVLMLQLATLRAGAGTARDLAPGSENNGATKSQTSPTCAQTGHCLPKLTSWQQITAGQDKREQGKGGESDMNMDCRLLAFPC